MFRKLIAAVLICVSRLATSKAAPEPATYAGLFPDQARDLVRHCTASIRPTHASDNTVARRGY